MRFLKAIYINNTTHKTKLPTMSNYNICITLALPNVHLFNVKLSSHNTNSTKHPLETTLATPITFTFYFIA